MATDANAETTPQGPVPQQGELIAIADAVAQARS